MLVHLAKKAQIVFLLIKKVTILEKYFNFLDVFLKEKVLMLLKQTKLNEHAIKMKIVTNYSTDQFIA